MSLRHGVGECLSLMPVLPCTEDSMLHALRRGGHIGGGNATGAPLQDAQGRPHVPGFTAPEVRARIRTGRAGGGGRSAKKEAEGKASWVTYRPEIKVLDCTIRDGGLINGHLFEDEFVRAVYQASLAAGVDYMEMGYKASKRVYSRTTHGAWKFCDEDDLRRIVGDEPDPRMKLCAMADAERTDYREDILPKDQSVLGCIRVACYIHQIPTAVDMIKDAHDKGYETTANLMAVSVVHERELRDAVEVLAASPADAVYVVDSFGSLYSEQVRHLVRMYRRAVEGTGKDVGIHAHNNQQLAYANTIEAIMCGANRLDATIYGLGRGAGNCPMELLLGFLRNPKFDQRPLIECIENHLLPLSKRIDWGYSVPYMVTGQLNCHPRDAMDLRESQAKEEFLRFYDKMME